MFQLEEDYLEITMKNSQQYTSCASFLDENETANNSHVVRAQHQQHHPLQSPFSISRSCSFFSSSIQSFAQVDHQANLGDNTIYPYQYQFTEILDTSMDHTFHQKKTSQPIFHNTESNSIITNIPTVSSIAALSSTVAATANNYDPSTSSTTTTLYQHDNGNDEGLIPISTKIRHDRTMTFTTSTRLRSTVKKKAFVYEYQELPKRYECTVCGKKFVRPSSLTTHSYSHTGEKPFQCAVEGCGRRFSVISNLRRHGKVHSLYQRK